MGAGLLNGWHEHLAVELRPHAGHDLGVKQRVRLRLAVELVPLAASLGLGVASRAAAVVRARELGELDVVSRPAGAG